MQGVVTTQSTIADQENVVYLEYNRMLINDVREISCQQHDVSFSKNEQNLTA